MHYEHTSEWLTTIQNLNEITNELIQDWDSKLTTSEFKQHYLRDFITEVIINDEIIIHIQFSPKSEYELYIRLWGERNTYDGIEVKSLRYHQNFLIDKNEMKIKNLRTGNWEISDLPELPSVGALEGQAEKIYREFLTSLLTVLAPKT